MTDTDTRTVHERWLDVMVDLDHVAKRDRNRAQNFEFRGIDSVLNAVGPILRKHRVAIVPVFAEFATENYSTAKGTAMREVTATVHYRVFGPAGDSFDLAVLGGAADSGDKAVPKAMSVALRTALLQGLALPTDEPDPDSESHPRGGPDQDVKAEVVPDNVDLDSYFRKRFHAVLDELGVTDAEKKAWLKDRAGVGSTNDLTDDAKQKLLAVVSTKKGRETLLNQVKQSAAKAAAEEWGGGA